MILLHSVVECDNVFMSIIMFVLFEHCNWGHNVVPG